MSESLEFQPTVQLCIIFPAVKGGLPRHVTFPGETEETTGYFTQVSLGEPVSLWASLQGHG